MEMKDNDKSNEELLKEIDQLNAKVVELEKSEVKHLSLKKTEEKLRESEVKFRLMFENMLNGFAYHKIVTDKKGKPIDYTFLEINDEFEKLTGLKRKDIIGKNATKILPGIENDPTDWIGRYGKVVLEGKAMKFERFSESIEKWYSIHAYAPQQGYFVTIFEDITERIQADQKIIQERNKALQYINIAEVMLVSIDSSGIVKLINPKGCEILGYSEEEIIGQNWFDMFLPERIKENVKEVSKKVFAGEMESVKYYENEIITKAGEERLIAWHNAVYKDDKGKVIGTLSSGEDITDRKQTEEALRESEEKFRHIFSVGKDGILIVDSESRIYMANITLCEMLGYGQDELIRFKMDDILHKDNLTQIHEKMELLARAEISIAEDIPLLKKDGSIVPTDIKASPISLNGKPYIIGAIRDITERKQAEVELAKHREHLEDLVLERTKELEDKNKELDRTMKVFVGRELKIRDLENRIRALEGEE